jgi:uncharacterized protein (DUF1499 family)
MPGETIVLVAGLAALGGVVTLGLLSALSRRPSNLGPRDGRLAPCPGSPNCVCSQGADAAHAVAPFAFTGSPEGAMKCLRALLASWPRTTVVREEEGYLHAECRSRVFRFVDDVELLLDAPASVVHVRSASRAGRSDLGVNRRRVEALRRAFVEGGQDAPEH